LENKAMHDDPSEFDRLDALMQAHPPAQGAADLPARIMGKIGKLPPAAAVWRYQVVQWLAAGVGIFFTLGRLLSYIFSAWLSIELAG
jgi:hypothetical protein